MVNLAAAVAATMPAKLSVCIFVNSGASVCVLSCVFVCIFVFVFVFVCVCVFMFVLCCPASVLAYVRACIRLGRLAGLRACA
jgi:hypothetical protein